MDLNFIYGPLGVPFILRASSSPSSIIGDLCSTTLIANGLSDNLKRKLYLYTQYLSGKVSSNVFIPIDFGSPLELSDKFRHHHFGDFKEVVDAI